MAIVNGQILSADLLVIGHTSDRVTSEFLRGLGIYLKNEKLHRNEDRAFNGLYRELLASVSFYSPFSVSFLLLYIFSYNIIQVVTRIVNLAIILQRIHRQQMRKTGIANITEKIKKHNIQINDIFIFGTRVFTV